MKHATLKQLKHNFLIYGKLTFFLLIFLIIIANIYFSQNISPLYLQVAKEDRKAVVNFLSKIKNLPEFESILERNKNVYGESIEQDVFAESVKRKQLIEEYQLLLEKNPLSRDVLYNLYILYLEDGEVIKAEEYLKKAKEIDPTINNI